MDFDGFFLRQAADVDKHASRPDTESNEILAFLGQIQNVDFGLPVQPEVVAATDMDFRASVRGGDPVALDDGHVQNPLFEAEIRGSLNEGLAFDVAQPSHGLIGVFGLVRRP